MKYAIDFAEGDVGECIRSREKLADAFVRLSKVLVNCNSKNLHLVDPCILPVVAQRNVAFMIELNSAARVSDSAFPFHYAKGFLAFGWSPNAVSMLPRFKLLEVSIAELGQSACELNARLIDSVGPSGDEELDLAAWEKYM